MADRAVIKSSPELLKFYKKYLRIVSRKWLPIPAKYKYKGLCLLAQRSSWDEMRDQFIAAGLNGTYPFGSDEYHDRMITYSQHKSPARIKWVKDRIADGSYNS